MLAAPLLPLAVPPLSDAVLPLSGAVLALFCAVPASAACALLPAACRSPLVCEGCVGQVQQVLDQQPVLHRHLQLDLSMDVIARRRLSGVGHLSAQPSHNVCQMRARCYLQHRISNGTVSAPATNADIVRTSWLMQYWCARAVLQTSCGICLLPTCTFWQQHTEPNPKQTHTQNMQAASLVQHNVAINLCVKAVLCCVDPPQAAHPPLATPR